MNQRSMSDGHGNSVYNGFSFSNGNMGSSDTLADWYAGNDPLGRTLSHWWCM